MKMFFYIFCSLLTLCFAAPRPRDESDGLFVLSSKRHFLPVVNVTSSNETSQLPAHNPTHSLTPNDTFYITPNTSLNYDLNTTLHVIPNTILSIAPSNTQSPDHNTILSTSHDTTHSPAQRVTAGSKSRYNAAGCGVPHVLNRSRRIINGTFAKPGQWPWMVRLDDLVCGGVLVTDRHVLTAAHCTVGPSVHLRVIPGGNTERVYNQDMDDTMIVEVRAIRRHDQYSFRRTSSGVEVVNDIAIIELQHPVLFTNFVLPICLPDPSTNFQGIQGTLLGWGVTYDGAPWYPWNLNQVDLPILRRETCVERHREVGHELELTPEKICTGQDGEKGACNGDSGSPLMVQDERGRWLLVGIVNGLTGRCADFRLTTFYANVSYFLPWIQQQLEL